MQKFFPVVLLLLAACGMTKKSTAAPATQNPSYLALVQADQAQIVEISGEYKLIMTQVRPHVVIMADRPVRKAAMVDVAQFVNDWTQGNNSFQASPPNAAFLSADSVSGQQMTPVIIEMSNPVLQDDNLTFTIKPVSTTGAATQLPTGQMKEATVFFDNMNRTNVLF